jgi:hypothetical protein
MKGPDIYNLKSMGIINISPKLFKATPSLFFYLFFFYFGLLYFNLTLPLTNWLIIVSNKGQVKKKKKREKDTLIVYSVMWGDI